jgi:uncharacterized protein with von Willebrand factor type A (vWA) domain
MFPFSSLPENLAAFCDRLRSDYGFRLGPRELADAARAVTIVPLADERSVRDALRPVLSHTHADVRAFDDAFERFFHPRPFDRGEDPRQRDRERPVGARGSTSHAVDVDTPQDERAPDATAESIAVGAGTAEANDEFPAVAATLRYSPLAGETPPPVLDPPDDEWRSAARMLVTRLRGRLSRTWRPSPRGQRFDLRRTLRSSLHTSGEPVLPRWRARVRRRPRFVVLVDGSRSMGGHAIVALTCSAAIASASPDVEVFTFSTAVHRITREVSLVAAGARVRLPPLHHAWGGGTSIGASLRELLQQSGDRLLGRDTVVIIASDGLEAGDPIVLRDAMSRLRRECLAIIWLNPLLETSGYEPSAQGMRVARPFVTTLAWVNDAASLMQLARTAGAMVNGKWK